MKEHCKSQTKHCQSTVSGIPSSSSSSPVMSSVMSAVLIQNAFDCMVNQRKLSQNAVEHSFPNELCYVLIDQLALNLVDIFLDNTLQILCKSRFCFAKSEKIDYSKNAKI